MADRKGVRPGSLYRVTARKAVDRSPNKIQVLLPAPIILIIISSRYSTDAGF